LQQQSGTLSGAQFERLYALANKAPLTILQWLNEGKQAAIEQAGYDFEQWRNGTLTTVQYQKKLAQNDFEYLLFQHLLTDHLKSWRLGDADVPGQVTRLATMQSIQRQVNQFNLAQITLQGQNKTLALLQLLIGIKQALSG
jgi:hypothetical protein